MIKKTCRIKSTPRIKKIFAALKKTYPRVHCELQHANPLELLVATILSAQCTDVQVNRVTPALFTKYRTARDYADAPPEVFAADIRSIGLYKGKAKNIQAACRILADQHDGTVPASMDALLQLPGVGRKTANVVLGNAFGIAEGIVVDTHVARLSRLLGLTRQTDPVKIEQDLMRIVPQQEWTAFAHRLIWHGRRRCKARRPDCVHCELGSLCPCKAQFVNKS